jgi:hypothetical protein
MNVQPKLSPFHRLWSLGYRRLIPIIPPDVPVTPTSAIGKKLANGKDGRGKVPGKLLPSGEWTSIAGWEKLEPTEADLATWAGMGANVGVKCGRGVVAIDADCLNPEHAALVRAEVEKHVGQTPVRIGRAPKALYLCRSEGDISLAYASIGYGDGDEKVEILSGQFVAEGMHQCGTPYRWESGIWPFDKLPVVSTQALSDLLASLERQLPKGKRSVELSALAPVDQKLLAGSVDIMREAIRLTPNTIERRSKYIEFGTALKASLPFHEAEAHEMWLDWGGRWEDGENDVETLDIDWASFKPPHSIGANYIYDMAFTATEGSFRGRARELMRRFHEHPQSEKTDPSEWGVISAASLADHDPPPQAWLVRDLIPAGNVTLLGGDGATGKSLLALQLAAAMSIGAEWLGMPVKRGRALFVTAEDEMDETHRRLKDITREPATFKIADLADLKLFSLDGEDAVIAAPSGKDGLLKPTEIMARLKRAIDRHKPEIVVLDTLADLFGGDEIKRVHARQFVGMLKGLCKAFDTTVLLLAHPSMSGMSSGAGTSGNTAWNNSVRSRLYMERRFGKTEQDEADPDVRVLTTKKANRARRGVRYTLRWSRGRFVREGVEIESRDADRNREDEEAFLRAFDETIESGRTLSHLVTAPNYAPKIAEAHPLAGGASQARFTEAMERLFARRVIEVKEFGPPSRVRRTIIRTKRIADADESEDLFE